MRQSEARKQLAKGARQKRTKSAEGNNKWLCTIVKRPKRQESKTRQKNGNKAKKGKRQKQQKKQKRQKNKNTNNFVTGFWAFGPKIPPAARSLRDLGVLTLLPR